MIKAAAERVMAGGWSPARAGRDDVNLAMVNSWLEAIGDSSKAYAARSVAPPAMTQVWTMRGLRPAPDPEDPLRAMSAVLDEAGYDAVVATNCEQTYHRYLRIGERVAVRSRLTDVAGPKRTALGEGWFVTTESIWYVGGEAVATMLFRVLKYRPAAPASTGPPPRPVASRDTAFFWDGCAAGELRVQRCGSCGALRHPPGPACLHCGALDPGFVVAAGTGTVYSYVVHHHPPMPGRRLPFVVALVELAEGVRMVGELVGVPPDEVRVGMPVEVAFVDGLPVWRPAGLVVPDEPPESDLPELRIAATPTFIIAAALATRDFQDVHHDRDGALARGSRDIFVNILTTTGLVQRYVTDWAGPDAVVRSIAVRLGVPCYAYDTLTFTGRVAEPGTVEVVGRTSLGTHVTGTVRLAGGPA
jgi:uncharacterized OB-fold protein